MSYRKQQADIANLDTILNPSTTSLNALTQWKTVRSQIRQNVLHSSSNTSFENLMRSKPYESSSQYKLNAFQTEMRNKMRNQNSNINYRVPVIEDYKKFTPGKKSTIDISIKSPQSVISNSKIHYKSQDQRELLNLNKKLQSENLTNQVESPKQQNIEQTKENLQNLQQKIRNLRFGIQDRKSQNQQRTQNDVYIKKRLEIPLSSNLQFQPRNFQDQHSQNLQSKYLQSQQKQTLLQDQFVEFKGQSLPVQNHQQAIQHNWQEFEDKWQQIVNKELTSSSTPQYSDPQQIQQQNYEPINGDYVSGYRKKQQHSKLPLYEVFTVQQIKEIQAALIQCTDGEFEKLSSSYVDELSRLATIITHKIRTSNKHSVEIMNL